VRTYSRGMSQRLALARALLHEPDLLLLDEPFSGLDPEAVERLQELLLELRAAGHAIVLATHDVDRAAPVASRLAILHRGRIAWAHDGRADDAAVIVAAYRSIVAQRA
jgi:ABC-type multidrug transport system ATPase subunit